MAFGDRLKEARETAGLTRPQLAEKLGVTKSAISNYENGISSPKEDIMLKIFNALDVTPNFLFQDSFVKLDITQDEADIISTYRKLDKRGKKAVCDTLKREYSYIEYSYIEDNKSHMPDVEQIAKEAQGIRQTMIAEKTHKK